MSECNRISSIEIFTFLLKKQIHKFIFLSYKIFTAIVAAPYVYCFRDYEDNGRISGRISGRITGRIVGMSV